jgi:NitT/TauT family transport system permease protein
MRTKIGKWFRVKAELSSTERIVIGAVGAAFLFALWYITTAFGWIPRQILPNPIDVAAAFPTMLHPDNPQRDLFHNLWYSLQINFMGIAEAVALSVPIGLAIGLFTPIDAVFGRFTANLRYLPLTAVVGLFVVNFGIGMAFKVHFLAAGIFVYLMPAIAKRCGEVKDTYKNTARTLGASEWELVKTVYFPAVMQKSKSDILNLMAVSWTYIIIVENYYQENGIGVLAWRAGRQYNYENLYVILILIFTVGLLQDWGVKKLYSLIGRIWKRYFNLHTS